MSYWNGSSWGKGVKIGVKGGIEERFGILKDSRPTVSINTWSDALSTYKRKRGDSWARWRGGGNTPVKKAIGEMKT